MEKTEPNSFLFMCNPQNKYWTENNRFQDFISGKLKSETWTRKKECKQGDCAYIVKTSQADKPAGIIAIGTVLEIWEQDKTKPNKKGKVNKEYIAEIKFSKFYNLTNYITIEKLNAYPELKGQSWINQRACISVKPSVAPLLQEILLGKTPLNSPNEDKNDVSVIQDANKHPLNLILYGPPGTGKTYNTVNEALSIIEGKTVEALQQENREDVLQRYRDCIEKGQIVFTTFHQSLSYEEFIEGIKPIPIDGNIIATHKNEDDTVGGPIQFGNGTTTINNLSLMKYEVVDGIFKSFSKEAADNLKESTKHGEHRLTVQELLNAYCDKNEESNLKMYLTKDDGSAWHEICPIRDSNNNIKSFYLNYGSQQRLTRAIVERDWDRFLTGEIKTFTDVKPSRGSNPYHGNAGYYFALYKSLKKFQDDFISTNNIVKRENVEQKKYVIIIDEINRGNVSQIFGELITLLEEDKRLGNSEELKVQLPYSSSIDPDSEPFGVPNNLYIIGTMNTADRSVEALDTALRRRFEFKEMMPNSKIKDENGMMLFYDREICGVKLGKLMDTINNRIRVLKDREHQIGHSYFMKCTTVEDLKNVFKNNIVPLLQEYFYGNYAYIGLVLGDRFVKKDTEANNQKFATFDGKDSFENNTDPQYKLLDEKGWRELDMEAALQQLIGQQPS